MATSSIGKTVRLNKETGKKLAKLLKNPHKISKTNRHIRVIHTLKDSNAE